MMSLVSIEQGQSLGSGGILAQEHDVTLRKEFSLLIHCYHSSGSADRNTSLSENSMTGSFAWTLQQQLKSLVEHKLHTTTKRVVDVSSSLEKKTKETHQRIREVMQGSDSTMAAQTK